MLTTAFRLADASQLRGMTQGERRGLIASFEHASDAVVVSGKGEFTMEYLRHAPVLPNVQKDMMEAHRAFTTKK